MVKNNWYKKPTEDDPIGIKRFDESKPIGLIETKAILEDMLAASERTSDVYISKKRKEAIRRALIEVEITIDNGDKSNL